MFSKSILALAGLMLIASPARGRRAADEQGPVAGAGKDLLPEICGRIRAAASAGPSAETRQEWALLGIDVDELLAK